MTVDLSQTRRLGERGPMVSRVCLGTMMFGDQTDEAASLDIVARYKAAGGRFIDTADRYANGESERIVGRAIARDRSDWILATKLGNTMPGDETAGGLSARWIARGSADCFERLQTDFIDILYAHRDDENTPLEETVEAFGALIESGRVGAWGLSNFRGWRIAEVVRQCDLRGAPRPAVHQPYYHALNRLAEAEIIPAATAYGMGIVPYSPLARGLLTGKYAGGAAPEGSRAARNDKRILETDFRPEAIGAADAIVAHARASGRTPIGFAVQWVLANPLVDSVLIGPKNVSQLETYLAAAAEPALRPEDEAAVDAVAPLGCAVGAWADPQYPYRGRPTP